MFLTASPVDAPGGIATVLYILVALMGLLGVGGITGWWKGRKESAVKDDKIDRVLELVLDPESGLESHTRELADIKARVSRNGGGSQSVGDIASRLETAVGAMRKDVRGVRSSLDQHIGQHDERDASIATRVALLERHRKEEP